MDFRRVKAGDDIVIKAEVWNAFLDAAEFTRRQQGKTGKKPNVPRNASVVKVQNVSDSQMDQYSAVAVTGVISEPDDEDDTADETLEFTGNLVLTVDVPTSSTSGRWLVLCQPLGASEIGLAVSVGVTPCWINVEHTTDTSVDSVASSTTPQSGSSGNQILWVAGGAGTADETGEQYSVIKLGGGGGSAQQLGASFTVYLTQTGGSAGDATTQCSFTYTAKDVASTTLATSQSPQIRTQQLGVMTAATFGTAYHDNSGTFKLLIAYEVSGAVKELCPS